MKILPCYFIVSGAIIAKYLVSATPQKLKRQNFKPTWESLDSRQIPAWYDKAKFGVFIHWGVYSVPSFGSRLSEWFWWKWKGENNTEYDAFMRDNYAPGFSYADFASSFRAELFDPDFWADLIMKSGARYVVFTSKHHDGWTNWKSKVAWNWNSVDVGPHRDLVGELASSVRNLTNVTFGLYFSLKEWFNPIFLHDKQTGFKTRNYVDDIMLPQLHEIVNRYKPEYLWTDGDWVANYTYWRSREFLAWLYNDSPVRDTVVTNDRWGKCRGQHGGVFTCGDRYNPGVLQKYKWENALTIDRWSWGYRRNAKLDDFLTMDNLTEILASTVSCGGNMLLNVGPTSDGRIDPIFQERLNQMGEWLGVNGEAIYSTKPWRAQNDTLTPGVWYTSRTEAVYAIILEWPSSGSLTLGEPITAQDTDVRMLGYPLKLSWKAAAYKKGMTITFPAVPNSKLPCGWAWVISFTNIK